MWNFFPPQLRADGRSPKMIEHLGQERCKKTSEKLERQRANKFEVKMAESAHDKAFGDVSSMFAVIDLNMLQYRLSIITTCILLDLSVERTKGDQQKTAVWREVITQSAYIHFMPYIYNTTVLRKLKNI